MKRRHRAVVAGVHRGQKVETLLTTNFAEDDAVGAHTQRVDDEVANGDRALAFEVRRAGFERQPVRLLQRSSAASSIVMTRSPGSIIFDMALSMVVLPEPVPPEMTTFMRLAPAIFSTVAIFSDIEPKPRIMSSVIGFSENLRIEMAVPRSDSGGMMTLTRLPSWRRASASGVVWSTRRPTLLTMRWAIWNRCSSSRNWILASSSLPLRSMKDLVGAVDHDVADRRVGQQLFQRPEAEQFVDQHLFQRELLAAVEGDLQLGEHFADDRPEFLGQLVLAERRGRFGIDAFEQARKHLFLDPVDRGFEAFAAWTRRRRRWRSGGC